MLKKVFLLPQFGKPHAWTQQYLDHVGKLEPYGWYWKIFTPNAPSIVPRNVEIIPMSLYEFDCLVEKRCGVQPKNYIHDNLGPHKLISDYYVAFGDIFQQYIVGFDYWGHTNWDVVYGRPDHFVPDTVLGDSDIWSDDPNTINGVFCLYRNDPSDINTLYKYIPFWREMFTEHRLFGTDELHMTNLVRDLVRSKPGFCFNYPPYFGYHSYDRLIQHQPEPQLVMMEDGALIEKYEDWLMKRIPDHGLFSRGYFGREIMYFHFINTKRWPKYETVPMQYLDTEKHRVMV